MRRTTFGVGAVLVGVSAALAVLAPAAESRADGSAIVVVVEGGSRVDPGAVRRDLTRELGLPAVSLADARAREARGLLSIVVDASGRRASVAFRPNVGLEYDMQVSVESPAEAREAGWVVAAAARVVRASDAWAVTRQSEILDPWGADREGPYLASADLMRLPPEVIDPFAGSPSPPLRITSADFFVPEEVLDPWADAGPSAAAPRGPAYRLSRPSPGRAERPAAR